MKLEYSHFSPYQFSTAEQIAEPHKKVVAQKKEMVDCYMRRKREGQNLGCTITVAEAHSITSLPTAFISPNPPDVMRQTKSLFKF
jgi:hypothetical protein